MNRPFSKLLIIAFVLCFAQKSIAQTINILKKADAALNAKDFYYALEDYLKVYDKKPNDPLVIEKILLCNKFLHNYNDVLTWSTQLTRLSPGNADYQYAYASALQNLGRYAEAKKAYLGYVKMVPSDHSRIDPLVRSCDTAIKWTLKPVLNIQIQNVKPLNSSFSEFGLTRFSGGFMFSSDRHSDEASKILSNGKKNSAQNTFGGTGRPYIKLYYVNYNPADSSWSTPAFFSKLITEKFHTSSASYDEASNILYFARTRKIDIPKSFNQSTFRVELVYTEGFKEIKPFPYNSILNYSVGDPCIAMKGKRLYFASDMPGGYGGSDLYYCDLKSDGTWGSPQNLGPEVNSAGQERYPSMAGDSVLYFSSDGHIGMGGLDIFSSVRNKKGVWSSVFNLGPPINSADDDFSVLITKSEKGADGQNRLEGYFSSDRPGGQGSDDIYSFQTVVPEKLKNMFFVQGKIVNSQTGEPLGNVKMKVKEVAAFEQPRLIKTDTAGGFKFSGKKLTKYAVQVKRDRYFAKRDTITSGDDDDDAPIKAPVKPMDLKLEPMVINKAVRLENIYYKFNQWAISDQASGVLDGLASTLEENPEIDIELSSHTDTRGDAAINKYISQQRALTAVKYLVGKGIDAHRIFAKGYGKEQPLVKCGGDCSEEDHRMNRRTEFKIIRIKDLAGDKLSKGF